MKVYKLLILIFLLLGVNGIVILLLNLDFYRFLPLVFVLAFYPIVIFNWLKIQRKFSVLITENSGAELKLNSLLSENKLIDIDELEFNNLQTLLIQYRKIMICSFIIFMLLSVCSLIMK